MSEYFYKQGTTKGLETLHMAILKIRVLSYVPVPLSSLSFKSQRLNRSEWGLALENPSFLFKGTEIQAADIISKSLNQKWLHHVIYSRHSLIPFSLKSNVGFKSNERTISHEKYDQRAHRRVRMLRLRKILSMTSTCGQGNFSVHPWEQEMRRGQRLKSLQQLLLHRDVPSEKNA